MRLPFGERRPEEPLPCGAIPCRLALIAVLCGCAVGSAGAATQTRTLTALPAAGAQFHCTWSQSDARRAEIAGKLSAAGLRTVRIDIGWSSLEPRRRRISAWHLRLADRCVNLARANGMEVLVTLMWTPGWANGGRGATVPPRRVSDFARFARWAARHFRGRVAAWEIWNEPNLASFWKGSVRRYVRLLRAAYPAIKAGDRTAKVVFGGIVHNDDRYLRAAYRAGARGAFDVMATHPYQGVADAAPETADDGDDWWLLTHVPAVRDVMARNGDGAKPIWFTELGWSVHENRPDLPPWQRGVSPAEQAAYLTRAFALVGSRYPYVERAFWYKDAARSEDDEIQAGYGLLRADLGPRPAYIALKALLAG
ncbi:MAG TPA: cellulase family glycosylhydrolase [Gaiellaceae bacterium]|nr:cellulase family glycosylhydrolase [Gaiellaceae bacterium]